MIGNDGFAPVHVACSVGNEGVLNYLLFKKMVDPNIQANTQEWVPLEIACWNGHPRLVNILLKDKRTNLNYAHPQRGSCLHLAAKGNHFQIVQMLLMHGIDFNLQTSSGQKAKDITGNKKFLDIIAFYEKNANASIKGEEPGDIQKKLLGTNTPIYEEEAEEEDKAS